MTTMTARMLTMETKAMVAAAAWQEQGVRGGGSAAAALAVAVRRWQHGNGGSGSGSAFEGCIGGHVETKAMAAAAAWGEHNIGGGSSAAAALAGVAVLIELGRGVPIKKNSTLNSTSE
jgi:hypothetical protein